MVPVTTAVGASSNLKRHLANCNSAHRGETFLELEHFALHESRRDRLCSSTNIMQELVKTIATIEKKDGKHEDKKAEDQRKRGVKRVSI